VIVGPYRIEGEIGRGATTRVYRATDASGRVVALKSPSGDAGPDSIRRILREVRLTARLMHPNIVRVLGALEHGGAPWLVMQLVEGASLGALLDEHGALPPADVVRHGEGLASALEFAHARAVLHEDVSPNNVLISSDGRAMLSDFGLASLASPGRGARRVSGTAGYIAPERIVGHAPDARSDVFSLGAVLYEMATGRPAFPGGTPDQILDATLEIEPAEMGTSPGLERIVRRALAKAPEERYPSAEELAADLASWGV
jgi:serine/threonine-protein kinase